MTVVWSITDHKGAAFPLDGKEVHLYYTCERGRFEAEIEIQDGNVVVWHFYGKKQRALGSYTLTLEVLQSQGKRAIKRDVCNAFVLVGKDCEEHYEEFEGDISEGGQIFLASELDIFRISPIIPQIGENGNWWVDGQDTGRPASSTFILDFTVEDLQSAIDEAEGVIEKQTDKAAIVSALKSHALVLVTIAGYSEGYCLVQGEEDGAGTLSIEFDYSGFHYTALIENDRIEVDRKKIGSDGTGLKYSEERTVYLTEIHILGEVDVAQISDEERAYNIETFNNAWNNQNVFISWFGTYFNPIEMHNGETYGSATFNSLAEYNGILVSYIIKVDTNGDAVAELKEIQTGSTTPSDFNNDFNNDF